MWLDTHKRPSATSALDDEVLPFLLPSFFLRFLYSPTSVYVLVHSLQLPNALMKTGKSILRYVVGFVTWLLLLLPQGVLFWSD
ncbi:hypothetical protein BDV38DRAFT_20811 [Aspergillus pseudotamarii]|uniref:Uncharacterized protein n=1 Tax=Aspergillus pseudotamarii TaxID=132259 RepID=A0A5N6SC56_ASPPS|nr:uncharacterized protein BDV38DRAFT_20811 [Aspergillus pseudotamarii]KAE8131439.1 hypothetical protein BDV38DRAFT_20811 [Aspergillus pseudotamarii]